MKGPIINKSQQTNEKLSYAIVRVVVIAPVLSKLAHLSDYPSLTEEEGGASSMVCMHDVYFICVLVVVYISVFYTYVEVSNHGTSAMGKRSFPTELKDDRMENSIQ